jgi:hypothetical protein
MTTRLMKPRNIAMILLISICMCFGPASWAQVETEQTDQAQPEEAQSEQTEKQNGVATARTQAPDAVKSPEQKEQKSETDPAILEKIAKFIDFFHFETLWYLHYRYGHGPKDSSNLAAGYDNYNRFDIGRGYLTLKFSPADWFESRITLDAHQDESGDMKVLLKYLYGKFTAPIETVVITEPFIEFGLVHMPWLDYEEHINWYRAQGTMLMERNKLFNSADFGVTVGALLGKKLGKQYQDEVSNKYPGSFGSLALGVYNGGGYHAAEANENKPFEARLSIRPLGPIVPNLQLSYFTVVGQGNLASADDWDPPKWLSHTMMASVEHRYFVLAGQFVTGSGNQKGDFVDWTTTVDPTTNEEVVTGIDKVQEYKGASGFMEIKLPCIASSVIGRYDWFDKKGKDDLNLHRIIAGYAYHFYKFHKNFVMLDLDYVMPDDAISDAEPSYEIKLTLQISL